MYESLSWCPVKPRSQVSDVRFFIPKSWIENGRMLPDIDGAESMAALATYEGDFVLAADKKWQYLEVLTPNPTLPLIRKVKSLPKRFLTKPHCYMQVQTKKHQDFADRQIMMR